jgi:hypothetical protein
MKIFHINHDLKYYIFALGFIAFALSQSLQAADATYDATEAAEINANTQNIAAEETARIAADTALGGRIDDEENARTTADTALGGRIDAEETARTTADTALGGRIDAEETARTAADTALGGRIDAEETARTAADTALGGRIDAEETARIAADTALGVRIDAEETARTTADTALGVRIDDEETARIAADTALGVRIDDEETARIAADTTLQNNINMNSKQIDRNTRGIAMVAALTHTTVLPGMTQALDMSVAHFDGETGMAISYSRRINEGMQVNFGVASTTDFEESVMRAGIGFQW